MDLFHKLKNDEDFLEFFTSVLEGFISEKSNRSVVIDHKVNDISIFFFIDGSSILQIIPDSQLQYTYANVPNWEPEIRKTLKSVEKQWNREVKIDKIIKKES
jgi:hypothetical protein